MRSQDVPISGVICNKSSVVVVLIVPCLLSLFRKERLHWSVQHVPIPVETYRLAGSGHRTMQSIAYCSPRVRCKLIFSYRWLYSLFLAVDANFRLKLKDCKIKDPEIGSGWAYFVENDCYIEHVSRNTNDVEVGEFPLCSSQHLCLFKVTGCGSDFHTVNQANRKSTKDYVASGVIACICARHSLMMKNGVGDLQRGERYVHTHFIAQIF